MLILTRRTEESITIGDDIEIQICGVRGDAVRLGIKAPKSVGVHREEVYQRIVAEQPEAQEDAPTAPVVASQPLAVPVEIKRRRRA